MAETKADEPKLCPNCPFSHLIPRILASQISYTREKAHLSNHKLCSLLRAYAQKHPWVSLQGCPYFAKTERIDLYATPKPPAR